MHAHLKTLYRRAMFKPSLLGVFVNPFYLARKGLYCSVKDLIQNLTGTVLDIGCGSKPYEQLCRCSRYDGLEIDSPANRANKRADYFYDGVTIPFADDSYDNVLSNQVLEHVFEPDQFLCEINRVIRLGGQLLLTVPFVWDEHEQPHDFARYSSFGLKHLLERSGFEITEQRKTCDGVEVVFQLLNVYLFKVAQSRLNIVNIVLTVLFLSPSNLLGILLSKISPRNPDFYLDNIVLATKVRTATSAQFDCTKFPSRLQAPEDRSL